MYDFYLPIVGAYGKKYDSQKDFFKDWDAGVDFKIVNGPYFSKRDTGNLLADGYIGLRYSTSTGAHFLEL